MTGSEFVQRYARATGGAWEKAVLEAVSRGEHVAWPMVKVPCGPASYFFATADYLSIGTPADFVRVPIGGAMAQTIADRLGWLLLTSKMVDRVWVAARSSGAVLEPMTMPANDPKAPMTSVPVFAGHNAKVQMALDHVRSPASPLVAGIKKDVIVSARMKDHPGMLAFHGWHHLDGRPIQGNSFAHVEGYFDYSHGVRFAGLGMVYDGKEARVLDVLADPARCTLLSSEGVVAGVRYGAMNPITIPPTVRRGSQGSVVSKWQAVVGAKVDGDFGPRTEEMTKRWQAAHHLTADGVVGPHTWQVYLSISEATTMPKLDTNMPFVQAKNFNKLATKKNTLIVIHTMEAPEKGKTAENIASYFAGANAPRASAHYCIDNDSIVQCVTDGDVAWHTPGKLGKDYVNNFSIGLEHAGYAKQTPEEWSDPYSQAMLRLSAQLAAKLCKENGIPVVRLTADDLKAGKLDGFCGHVDCTNATGTGTHWDPGPSFPWDEYLALVEEYLA